MRVFKICRKDEWVAAKKDGVYTGTKMDRGYGFIHLCTDKQLPTMLSRYGSKANDMVVLEIDADRIKSALRYEREMTGGVYPHLYDMLMVNTVVKVRDMALEDGGRVVIR